MLRFLTAGESHGPCLTVILEGVPARMPIDAGVVDAQLGRRQEGYGRSGRQRLAPDQAVFLGGVRNGLTTGAPIAIQIANREADAWALAMGAGPVHAGSAAAIEERRVTRVRPGHADLAGATKYGHPDARDVLERASARETAARVAAGAVARLLLAHLGVAFAGHVLAIGGERAEPPPCADLGELLLAAESSPVRCADPRASARMVARIDRAGREGHSVGGVFEVVAAGLPVGLGSYAQWDRRLDGRLAQALMSIPAIKGVEIGAGFALADLPGDQAPDEIFPDPGGARPWRRETNRAGGLEGGVSNGEPLVLRAAMKPISTMRNRLRTIDLATGEAAEAHYERADLCAVPAAAVIGEAMAALVLADAALEKYGGDSLDEFLAHFRT